MAGKPREDRGSILSRVIAVRVTTDESEALDIMVEAQNKKLVSMGYAPVVTAASFCRSLVIREAASLGLLPEVGPPPQKRTKKKLRVMPPSKRPTRKIKPEKMPPPTIRFDRVALDRVTYQK